jgi:hypothetical protein
LFNKFAQNVELRRSLMKPPSELHPKREEPKERDQKISAVKTYSQRIAN